MVLGVCLPLISCHGWHVEPNRQGCLLDFEAEGQADGRWRSLKVLAASLSSLFLSSLISSCTGERMLAHHSSLRTLMSASQLGGHVNLLLHCDQVGRIHYTTDSVLLQFSLSLAIPVAPWTSVEGPIPFHYKVWMVQLRYASFCCLVQLSG